MAGVSLKNFIAVVLATSISLYFAYLTPSVKAEGCFFCDCCVPTCRKAQFCGAAQVTDPALCDAVCHGQGGENCGSWPCAPTPTPPGGGGGGGGGSGGGGGGTPPPPPPPPNHPPTCTIQFPTDGGNPTVVYDALKFLTPTGTQTRQPTVRRGRIVTQDPDGDAVSITSFTTTNNCVALQLLAGGDFTLVPQGAVTGKNLALPSRVCTVTLKATVQDSKGKTGSCQKTIDVAYAPPLLQRFFLRDAGNDSVASDIPGSASAVTRGGFLYIGGSAPDPGRYQMAALQGTKPRQYLPPPGRRFIRVATLKADHAPFKISAVFYDYNGHFGFNPAQVLTGLYAYNNPTFLQLKTNPDILLAAQLAGIIYTYGIKNGGGVVNYNTYSFPLCLADMSTLMGV